MNEIKIFNNSQFGDIRTATTENGEPLFCLIDLCRILEIKNVPNCKSRLNQNGIVSTDTIDSMGSIGFDTMSSGNMISSAQNCAQYFYATKYKDPSDRNILQ